MNGESNKKLSILEQERLRHAKEMLEQLKSNLALLKSNKGQSELKSLFKGEE